MDTLNVALNLKSNELEKLVRRRARRRGETLTEAILTALQESERNAAAGGKAVTAHKILELAKGLRKLPVLSTRSEDEILGYDERGIPRQ